MMRMANAKHLSKIKAGGAAWNKWRAKNPQLLPDLTQAELAGRDFHAVDFKDTRLVEANLSATNLVSAIFRRADLGWVNLADSNLSTANLAETQLWGATLRNANLSDVDLEYAILVGADLSGADLSGANLDQTNLRGANLSGSILNGAHLTGTDLTSTDITDTDFSNAEISLTVFGDVDLTKAKRLDTVIHHGPSTIGVDTLFKSKGQLPEAFLRGCGVPEEFIRYVPCFINQPIQFYSCFISYSHDDKAFARLLHDRLQGQGIRCWLDEHQLLPGDDLHDRIDQGIKLWDKVLLCASKSSLTSWWVDGEINRAFQKEAELMKERSKLISTPHPGPLPGRGGEGGRKVLALIPLNLDSFLFSDEYQSGKKTEIKSRAAANFVGWEKDHALFDRELEKVIRALRTGDAGREKPPQPRL